MVDVDVLIAGAGPVGLMLANQLGQRGIRTLLVERNASTVHEPRAIAVDDETCRTMQGVGLGGRFGEHVIEGLPFAILGRGGDPIVRVDVTERPYGHPWIGAFYQPALESMLAENLARLDGVDLRFEHSLRSFEDRGTVVEARVENAAGESLPVRARWLVGCDGASSGVRQQLGIGFGGRTYEERWLIVDCANDVVGKREMHFLCDTGRPTVTLPAPGGRRRWEFLLHPGEGEEEVLQPESIAALLSAHHAPELAEIERATVYSFHARTAERFRVGRVLLAGDAAHVMPPFAGQGLNSGIRDAANLGWKLALVVCGRSDPALLDSYDAERRWHVRSMTRLAMFLGWVLMPRSWLRMAARNLLFRFLNAVPPARRFLASGRLRPAPSLGRRGAHVGRGRMAGRMLPQVEVETAWGQRLPFDDVVGPRFVLLGIDVDPDHRDDRWTAVARALGARTVCVHTDDSAPRDTGMTVHVHDRSGVFRALGRGRELLVRPDRFVMASVDEGERDAAARAIEERLHLAESPGRRAPTAAGRVTT